MATDAQSHANRQNARKSTGPSTPHGKANIAQNALKHGLTARQDVITPRRPSRVRPPARPNPRRTKPPHPYGIHARQPHRKPLMATKTRRQHPEPGHRRHAKTQTILTTKDRPSRPTQTRSAGPRSRPRTSRNKGPLKFKGPRTPPHVRTPNREQPIQNSP